MHLRQLPACARAVLFLQPFAPQPYTFNPVPVDQYVQGPSAIRPRETDGNVVARRLKVL